MTNLIPRYYLIMILLLCNLINCTTTRDYFYNRARDAGDIFNVGIEKDVYGGSFFIDQVGLGFQHASNGKGLGTRYGHFGFYRTGSDAKIAIYAAILKKYYIEQSFGNSKILINSFEHLPLEPNVRNKDKIISIYNGSLLGPPERSRKNLGDDFYLPSNDRISYIFAPIEFSFGFYLGIRVGFNTSEFFDFILGIMGFDIIDDDLGYTIKTIQLKRIRGNHEIADSISNFPNESEDSLDYNEYLAIKKAKDERIKKLQDYANSLDKEKKK
ncbi:MAG: hypothetical protein SFU98_05010 [Leptospiraceae bacterium]|nr:hypothetical protein [Leptospiraceae bacterium]